MQISTHLRSFWTSYGNLSIWSWAWSLIFGFFRPFSAGTAFMLMQTGWIQASHRVTRRLAWDPTCLLLSPSFPIINMQNLKVLKSRRQYNLLLKNYPAFKGLKLQYRFWSVLNGHLYFSSTCRCYVKALKILPECSSLWHDLGISYLHQSQCSTGDTAISLVGKAEQALKKAIQLEPNNHRHWTALGFVACAEGTVNFAYYAFHTILSYAFGW